MLCSRNQRTIHSPDLFYCLRYSELWRKLCVGTHLGLYLAISPCGPDLAVYELNHEICSSDSQYGLMMICMAPTFAPSRPCTADVCPSLSLARILRETNSLDAVGPTARDPSEESNQVLPCPFVPQTARSSPADRAGPYRTATLASSGASAPP
jgi:hypothetical protein